eukprot:CAMPEP_0201687310 /NCGR_PEP_ID=MMETSP0578-20130828/1430_1 /ASSEMBLY_ACC=CAM_ASM_000663 /TAXON_ID=267565 /ORGANISM="Skeletonema grethea, Strain CCMP 1804" /LENGTH=322 /DNA_ID=CAMNT_0048171459 /DNA_START=59 /DNA_END=1027 /DNA_ORIENTATION=+
MITPKYINITLALIASSAAAVGAFTTTRTSFSPTSICYPVLQLQPRASFVSTPLQLLKKDMAATEDQPLLKAVENPADIDNGKNDLIAPSIYAAYTAALIFIIYQLRDAIVTKTLGSTALAFVTGALIWDNLIISIGSFFFKDIDTNPQKYKILKWLSYPRFTFHAIGVPLQLITVAEMGKFAGVGFLQSDVVQIGIILASFALAIADRLKFARSPGIEQTIWDKPPFGALERDLVKFGYVEPDFAYVIPAIILALSNLIVGIVALKSGVDPEVGKWMAFAGLSALIGNALPGSLMTFTGNLGEAGMQFGLLEAARIVYGGL